MYFDLLTAVGFCCLYLVWIWVLIVSFLDNDLLRCYYSLLFCFFVALFALTCGWVIIVLYCGLVVLVDFVCVCLGFFRV